MQNNLSSRDNSPPSTETSSTVPYHLTAASLADLVMGSVANDEHESHNDLDESCTSGNFQLMNRTEKHRQRAQMVRRRLLRAAADSARWRDDSGAPVNGDTSESGMPVVSSNTSSATSLTPSSSPDAASEVLAKPASPPSSALPTMADLHAPQAPPSPSGIASTSSAGATFGRNEEVEGDANANTNGTTPENLSNSSADLFFRRRMATTNLVLESLDIQFEGYFDSESTSETDSTISETGFEDALESILDRRSLPLHSVSPSARISTDIFYAPRL